MYKTKKFTLDVGGKKYQCKINRTSTKNTWCYIYRTGENIPFYGTLINDNTSLKNIKEICTKYLQGYNNHKLDNKPLDIFSQYIHDMMYPIFKQYFYCP